MKDHIALTQSPVKGGYHLRNRTAIFEYSKCRYFTYSELTSVDEGGDMQIRRWGTQIDDEKVDQQRWEGAKYQREDIKEEVEK